MDYKHNRKAFLLICIIIILVNYFHVSVENVSAAGLSLKLNNPHCIDTVAKMILIIFYAYFFLMMYQTKEHKNIYRKELINFIKNKYPQNAYQADTDCRELLNDSARFENENKVIRLKKFRLFFFPKFSFLERNNKKIIDEKIKYFYIVPKFDNDKTANLSSCFVKRVFQYRELFYLIILSHIEFSFKKNEFFEYIFPFVLGFIALISILLSFWKNNFLSHLFCLYK